MADEGPESLTISALAAWRQMENGSRLLLPPIQRSVVWSNEQIINYWDSLLRGYPAGMMIVHRVRKDNGAAVGLGRDSDGKTQPAKDDDFLLFDGQQRMAAVLLGFGKGQMKVGRKLWVDFGEEPNKSSGLKFQLRITSAGQPFGYRPDAPNQKIELGCRQDKWKKWKEERGSEATPQDAFAEVVGGDLIRAKCAVSFSEVCEELSKGGRHAVADAMVKREGASDELVDAFATALEMALGSKVILQHVARDIVADPDEYVRFFGRLGQGGTRLSDDELAYSIIKHGYPKIHDRINEIIQGPAGRLASEVDMVLSSLRVAKTLAPWKSAKEWEVISRPSPAFVSQLKNKKQVESKFLEMIPPENQNSLLEKALNTLRDGLSYHSEDRPNGLPAMLLACLPRELIDVLLLFAVKRGASQPWEQDGRETLCAFALHWLLFVADNVKAAWCTFQIAKDEKWSFSKESISSLIGEFERDGIARFLPGRNELSKLRAQVKEGDWRLRPWAERFTAVDGDRKIEQPGQALRVLSSDGVRIRRALMWLQRRYIGRKFKDYDPTSDRDDDLPIDLDHIIPAGVFDFDWRYRNDRLNKEAVSEEFHWQRKTVGDSIGNFRWLDASENRKRGKSGYTAIENNEDLVSDSADWNSIIPRGDDSQCWSLDNIATFQRLIDLRTIELYEILLAESGIETILPIVVAHSNLSP
jgi:hypothetical protein